MDSPELTAPQSSHDGGAVHVPTSERELYEAYTRAAEREDWTPEELPELERLVAVLNRAALRIGSQRITGFRIYPIVDADGNLVGYSVRLSGHCIERPRVEG